MNIVTRFAPSPTGLFHAGSYRTALFAWILARQNKGKFILRIEDTDKERSKKEYEEDIVESLAWLGLAHDEFYRQSDRTDIYKKHIHALIASGHAYISKENREGDAPTGRSEVIRFKNPNKRVSFTDLIRGPIEFDTTELGDFVIAKSENEPVFHLVVVIDDHEMGVTHVIRGEDHISNTPRQILIYEALGVQPPSYAHLPIVLGTDRSKLSKRKGAIAMSEYRRRGYLPEALVNYMALVGWHPSDDRELLSLDDILREFSLERIQKGGAIFDESKLAWFNKQYIAKLSDSDLLERAKAFIPHWLSARPGTLAQTMPLLRDKISSFSEIATLISSTGELGFIESLGDYSPELLLWKKAPDAAKSATHLAAAKAALQAIAADSFTPDAIKASVWPYAEANGRGDVLWPLRVSLTGKERSPDPFVSAAILGKDESISRIDIALKKLPK